jgi:hypothetical protein
MIVVADYVATGLFKDHGMFVSLGAYNQAKKTDTLLRCIPAANTHINIADDSAFNALPDGFTRIQNVHRSQKWIVQVESIIRAASLRTLGTTGIPPHMAKDILASVVELLSAARPLWFVPNLHPSHIFWEDGRVLLTGSGLSKLAIDREVILNGPKYKTTFKTDWFVTPEFHANPSPEQVLGSEDVIEKTIVYYLGLLAHWMLEGRFPFGDGTPGQGTPSPMAKFGGAQRLINAALAPIQDRITIYEFHNIMQDISWGWD